MPEERILISGGPKTGKTTFANTFESLGYRVRHTDDVMNTHDWSAASTEVATWLPSDGRTVIEGVSIFRALRKWLATNPDGKPCDVLYVMWKSFVEYSKGQASMAKGCSTVFCEISGELLRRGVRIEYR